MQALAKDMDDLGYILEWCRVDAQNYLLPQRRNRIYATADISAGQDPEKYASNMSATMRDFASDALLPFETVFDLTLPKQPLSGRTSQKLQEALEHSCLQCNSQNVFIDTSGSKDRKPESAVNCLTCIRPTHKIYSQQLQRHVTVEEMWTAQGLFASNFANPSAVKDMLSNPRDAQDLAGNAFASTCMQCKVLASLLHGHGWLNIADTPQPTAGAHEMCMPASRDIERGQSSSSLAHEASSQHSSNAAEASLADSGDVQEPAAKRVCIRGHAEIQRFEQEDGSEDCVTSEPPAKRACVSEPKPVVQQMPPCRLRKKTSAAAAGLIKVAHAADLEMVRAQGEKRKRGRPAKDIATEATVASHDMGPSSGVKGDNRVSQEAQIHNAEGRARGQEANDIYLDEDEAVRRCLYAICIYIYKC